MALNIDYRRMPTAALDRALRSDAAQTFSAAQKGRLRANLGAGLLIGYRNKIINGDFEFWQRNTTQTALGYGSDDRWSNVPVGGSMTNSQQVFTLGQTDVPGNPRYFSRTVVTHAAGAGNYHFKCQPIEGARILSGRTATITFYAKADASKNIGVEIAQYFGTGGSPSSLVSVPCGLKALTTSWQKFSFTVEVPSITGKTLGTNINDYLGLYFWFESGATNATRASSVGQQSGTFDIAHVSVVDGDATLEDDPFSPRHWEQELSMCQRYYEKSFRIETPPQQNFSFNGSTGLIMAHASLLCDATVFMAVAKRTTPTITTYSPNAANANWSTNSGTPAASIVSTGDRCFVIRANGGTAGGSYGIHWSAEAELL